MKVYALRLKDKHGLHNSSSGGAFTAISDVFLSSGKAVVSAIYNYDINQNEFVLYTTLEERDKARGSKYMQTYPLNSFRGAEQWVKEKNKELLFVGTGCQADGFRIYAEQKGFRDKTTIVGIICHGTPSPKIWKDYLAGKIDYLTFKDKRNGWKHPTAYMKEDGKEKSIADYVSIFYSKCALRPSCYECPYATTERKVDLTIGDFWGIDKVMPDFYSPESNSLVLVHTEKGQEIFEKIKDKVEWRESNTADCLQPNLINPTERSPRREEFWFDYRKKGVSFVIKKYTGVSFMSRIKRKVKEILTVGTLVPVHLYGGQQYASICC